MTYERMEDGSLRVAVPEPFWVANWRTWFRWRPACYECRTTYRTKQDYDDHYISVHAYTESQP